MLFNHVQFLNHQFDDLSNNNNNNNNKKKKTVVIPSGRHPNFRTNSTF